MGLGVPTDIPNVIHIVEINTITGGTGRFAGAQGNFVVDRMVNLTTQPAITFGSFQGRSLSFQGRSLRNRVGIDGKPGGWAAPAVWGFPALLVQYLRLRLASRT